LSLSPGLRSASRACSRSPARAPSRRAPSRAPARGRAPSALARRRPCRSASRPPPARRGRPQRPRRGRAAPARDGRVVALGLRAIAAVLRTAAVLIEMSVDSCTTFGAWCARCTSWARKHELGKRQREKCSTAFTVHRRGESRRSGDATAASRSSRSCVWRMASWRSRRLPSWLGSDATRPHAIAFWGALSPPSTIGAECRGRSGLVKCRRRKI